MADQLAKLGAEYQLVGPEPACGMSAGIDKKNIRDWRKGPSKILGDRNRTETGKGIHTRTCCQKNQGTVETKQQPVAVGDRTTHSTLSPERTPLQSGIIGYSHTHKVPRKSSINQHMVCDCEAIVCLRFRHLGHYLTVPGEPRRPCNFR
jgi:hypothetical protein